MAESARAPGTEGAGPVPRHGAEPDRLHRVAVFGGVYSNHLALAAAIEDARARDAEALFCLGDLGGFGPSPDKVFPILRREGVRVVQGNYDDSIGRGLDDCRCGYTDPRDNHYARLAYDYALSNTSGDHRRWLAALPPAIRFRLGTLRVLACHGSPRQVNEFLWETTTPSHFLAKLAAEAGCDVILGGHTGIHWARRFAPGGWYVNAGALGRPANDGRTCVWYAMVSAEGDRLSVDFVPVCYDHEALAREMAEEGICEEFITTIRTGWWTTCLEILPGKERARGRY